MIKTVYSLEAWEILKRVHNSFLIDVRSPKEWKEDGIPDLSKINKQVVLVPWQGSSVFHLNLLFSQDIKKNLPGLNLDTILLFICKSGFRSAFATLQMFTQGFIDCYNVEDGFLGNVNLLKKGWKPNNLPWHQNYAYNHS